MDETVRTVDSQNYKRLRSTDIILELEAIDGKAKAGSTGLIDKSLFQGDNKLHAIMDTQTCLWYLRYERGIVPEALKQRFTGYVPLLKFVTEYFKKRNVRIKNIID